MIHTGNFKTNLKEKKENKNVINWNEIKVNNLH